MDLENYFTAVNNIYSKSHTQNLHVLYKCSKIAVPKMPASKVSPSSHRYSNKVNDEIGGGKNIGRYDKTYDKKYWKDK